MLAGVSFLFIVCVFACFLIFVFHFLCLLMLNLYRFPLLLCNTPFHMSGRSHNGCCRNSCSFFLLNFFFSFFGRRRFIYILLFDYIGRLSDYRCLSVNSFLFCSGVFLLMIS